MLHNQNIEVSGFRTLDPNEIEAVSGGRSSPVQLVIEVDFIELVDRIASIETKDDQEDAFNKGVVDILNQQDLELKDIGKTIEGADMAKVEATGIILIDRDGDGKFDAFAIDRGDYWQYTGPSGETIFNKEIPWLLPLSVLPWNVGDDGLGLIANSTNLAA